jgi:hypothetical protein
MHAAVTKQAYKRPKARALILSYLKARALIPSYLKSRGSVNGVIIHTVDPLRTYRRGGRSFS